MPNAPTPSIAQLHAQRRALLDQIENLEQIRRGSITEQFVEAVHQDGTKVRRGPYVLYSYKDRADGRCRAASRTRSRSPITAAKSPPFTSSSNAPRNC